MKGSCFPSMDERVVVRTEIGFLEGIYSGYNKLIHRHIVDVPGPRVGERELVEVPVSDIYVSIKEHSDG